MEETGSYPRTDLDPVLEALRLSEARGLAGMLALELMHEIRNPLEALGYITYLCNLEADNPEKVRECMRLADEQMATVNHIIHQTLGFAKRNDVAEPIGIVSVAEAALRIHKRTLD